MLNLEEDTFYEKICFLNRIRNDIDPIRWL